MSYSVLIPGQIAAKNIDSLNKNIKHATVALENGHVVALGALSTTRQEGEVYEVITPATATLATDIFLMVYEPPIPVVNGKYKGLTDDPREFNIAVGKVANAFKPMIGDEVVISADGLAGTKSTNQYVIPANGTTKLTWAADASTTSLGLKYVGDTFISVGNERVTAYKFIVTKA